MTEEQYREAEDELAGYCTTCKEVTNHGGVEPDAEGYECECCGEMTVMGLGNALITGLLDIDEGETT